MNCIIRPIILLVVWMSTSPILSQKLNFNQGWQFLKGEAKGAENPNYDDSKWRTLNLPHDWAIEGPFSNDYNARCGGLPFHGTGWYRKVFKLDTADKGKIFRIEFEAAMKSSDVWINGHHLGFRWSGYISFEYELTQHLKFDGTDNVIAVRLKPEDLSSRWYPGAGLYRNVWLKKDNPIHVGKWGTFVTTPTVTKAKAVVQNETRVYNKSGKDATVKIVQEYYAPNGEKAATSEEEKIIKANANYVSGTWANIKSPKLWDIGEPNLYNVITNIFVDGNKVDEYKTRFGIRKIKYTTEGFFLNDKKVRLKGVCLHHDNGALGGAVYKRADERKLQIMRDMGVNAVRTSHNPPSIEFLEVCDEMGMLVLDEAMDGWATFKTKNGYHNVFEENIEKDITDFMLRDRNHPSVIMWSIGNEIGEQKDAKFGWKTAKRLHDLAKTIDKTRPTTVGLNNYPRPFDSNFAQQLDVIGLNYKPTYYEEVRKNYPDLIIYGSETESTCSSRGVYHFPVEKYKKHSSNELTGYDIIGPPWAYPPDIEFHFQEKNPYVLGEFVWTGFDYLGEPTPFGGKDNSTNGYWNGDWPVHSSFFGIVDMCGFPKDRYYLYQSQWTNEPMIHLYPHWNWQGMEGKNIPVTCYTNCEEAELFLNGKSLGKKIKGVDKTTIPLDFSTYDKKSFDSKYRLTWNVPYTKGTLKVVGYKKGKVASIKEIATANKPSKIELSVDRSSINATGRDLSYITVKVLDKNGNLCPNADNLIQFDVKGAGQIVGVDNGNQQSLEPFQAKQRKAYNGMCLAIVRGDKKQGTITVKATSKGLKSKSMTIKIQ